MTTPCCFLCGSCNTQKGFEAFDYWYNRQDLTTLFYECKDCKLIFQFPIPPKDEIAALYPNEYYAEKPEYGFLYERGLRMRCRVVLKHKKIGRLLDIGCATGEFMRAMRDWYQWQVNGIELDQTAADIGINRYQLNITIGDFNALRIPDQKFDVITLWDVLEHLPDPAETISKIRTVIKPDGLLVIRVPNADSCDASIFKQYWAGYDPPRHFFVFRKKTLKRLLQENGFSCFESSSSIGSYLNFVKSVKFLLTAKQISPWLSKFILGILSSIPARILTYPAVKLNDILGHSSAMTIITKQQA